MTITKPLRFYVRVPALVILAILLALGVRGLQRVNGAESEILSPVTPQPSSATMGRGAVSLSDSPPIGRSLVLANTASCPLPQDQNGGPESLTDASGPQLDGSAPPPTYGPDGAPNDRRNWMVANYKGGKYGVSPALLIAIRSHENPKRSRDRYALGVVCKKHTDIWTQYEFGARIVARIAGQQGWSPLEPTPSRLYRLGLVYVGRGSAAANHWSRCTWSLYKRALAQTDRKPNLK